MTQPQPETPLLARTQARDAIADAASAHGARDVRVFGSAARGEPSAHDLDLLVRMDSDRSLFDLIALSQELEEALGIDVDVLSENGLSPYLRDRILAEAVAL
jgi:predicted nucleotidyltransferase